MSTYHVFKNGKHVAAITRLPGTADGFTPGEPWALLHNTGRTDRFAKLREARAEAAKSYGRVTLTKEG